MRANARQNGRKMLESFGNPGPGQSRRFRSLGSIVEKLAERLDQETRAWLRDEMDLVADAGKDDAERLRASRKHAQVVRNCEGCGRTIRGNAFF
jgi:hypothetical protein